MTPAPVTLDELFPSKYLRASDIQGEQIFTIKEITIESLKNRETEKDEQKAILYFEESEKGIVLNKTNKNTLKALYGEAIADIIGKRVTLHTPDVEGFGKVAPAIRIKAQRPPADKSALLRHYSVLFEKAKTMKVSVDGLSVSPDMTEQQIVDAGKNLKAKVDAAEAKAEAEKAFAS
jgi:hypothetical protein